MVGGLQWSCLPGRGAPRPEGRGHPRRPDAVDFRARVFSRAQRGHRIEGSTAFPGASLEVGVGRAADDWHVETGAGGGQHHRAQRAEMGRLGGPRGLPAGRKGRGLKRRRETDFGDCGPEKNPAQGRTPGWCETRPFGPRGGGEKKRWWAFRVFGAGPGPKGPEGPGAGPRRGPATRCPTWLAPGGVKPAAGNGYTKEEAEYR